MSQAASNAPPPLDTLHIVETPEGVRLELRPAGPISRGLAYGLDISIRFLVYLLAIISLFTLLGDTAVPLTLLLVFVGEWFYPVLFEVLADGQTIGKRAFGLRVVNDDGTPIGWGASMLRNLLLAADLLPGSYLVGLVSMMSTRGFRRIGDLAAGTLVLHTTPVVVSLEKPPEAPATSRPPPIALSLDEQRAVIGFAERAATLSEARAEELARLAEPLLDSSGTARHQLVEIAAWLSGRGNGNSQ